MLLVLSTRVFQTPNSQEPACLMLFPLHSLKMQSQVLSLAKCNVANEQK